MKKITKQEAIIALMDGKEVLCKTFECESIYKISHTELLLRNNDEISKFIKSTYSIIDFYQCFTGDFYLYEKKEPTPPKFTPENITKIWKYDLGSGEGNMFTDILHLVDSAKKDAVLATPEEIQEECNRLNKLCEDS